MRVASNKLLHLSDFYFEELHTIYDKGEINALFQHAVNHYLGIPLAEINLRLNENVNQSELLLIYDCAKKLRENVPLQYILGETYFFGLRLKVNQHVLIPRPETEELVDLVVKECTNKKSFLDIGTGSGCIAIGIKSKLKEALVSGCDISPAAIETATKNAELNQCEVKFHISDVLNAVAFNETISGSFDVIISNPPYIKESEGAQLLKNVIDHEPHLALFVKGEDDILFYRKITDICLTKLNSGGKLYFELNPLTSQKVQDYAASTGLFKSMELITDLSGNTRFLNATKK